jgi:hypothetical protein
MLTIARPPVERGCQLGKLSDVNRILYMDRLCFLGFQGPSGIIVGRDPIHRSKTARLF